MNWLALPFHDAVRHRLIIGIGTAASGWRIRLFFYLLIEALYLVDNRIEP